MRGERRRWAGEGGLGGAVGKMWGKKRANVLVVGLDNSGKTTIIERLKPTRNQSQEVVPTVGFSVDSFSKGPLTFKAFDMSGAGQYRNMWEKHVDEAHCVIFVVDAADHLRVCVAKDELTNLLQHKRMAWLPLLVFSNKTDLSDALPHAEVARQLGLPGYAHLAWNITASNGLTGDGIEAGMMWLLGALKKAEKERVISFK